MPDSSLCRAATPRLHPLQLLLPDCIDPLQLLIPICVHFSCCSPIASASAAAHHFCPLQLLLSNCIRFNCSPIASASAAAPRLRPLQLPLPDCIHFDCCSPIASQLLFWKIPAHTRAQCSLTFFVEFEVHYTEV